MKLTLLLHLHDAHLDEAAACECQLQEKNAQAVISAAR
jgi:hypothetical protein